MAAYVVGTIRVTNAARWQQYVDRVGTTFAVGGGKVLVRGTKAASLAGDAHGERVVVIEFPDAGGAHRWHDSAEYQSLVALREAGADVVLTLYEA
jgi:uncharacterized protein (DUF1330 family)